MLMSLAAPFGFAVAGGAFGFYARSHARRALAVAMIGGFIASAGFLGFTLVQAATPERQRDAAEWSRGYDRCVQQSIGNYSAMEKCGCLFQADGLRGPGRLGYMGELRAKC